MRIGVIGNGVVGHATARCYMEHAEVLVYDVVPEKSPNRLHETIMDTDLVFVCLPEAAVDEFFSHCDSSRHYVLRSTVQVGTTKRLAEKYGLDHVVHSPEFLTARCAVTDAQLPARNIVGVPTFGSVNACCHAVCNLYSDRFPGVPLYSMLSDESELVKLATNAFFAVKVAYFNEINALAEKLDLDWPRIMEGILADGRIAHAHTNVPGPDGKYGFGGACLPKDLVQLIDCVERIVGLREAMVMRGASLRNDMIDRRRT